MPSSPRNEVTEQAARPETRDSATASWRAALARGRWSRALTPHIIMNDNVRTKYSQLMIRLMGVGGVFGISSWFIGGAAKDWVGGVGLLALAAGLVAFLAGTITERKELQAAHRFDDSK